MSENTTESEPTLTAQEIASKCIQGAIDQESKENITEGGYLWDLEKEIEKDIEAYAKANDSEKDSASGVRVNARVNGKAAEVADAVKNCAVDAHMGTEDPDKAKAKAIETIKKYGNKVAKQQRDLISEYVDDGNTPDIEYGYDIYNAPEPPL